ncbi:hypothetical protein [Planococcus sp. SSTMD024]|uniref:hypothetical protein n=1 Tax=Planococcus sp. SSTMD024 TaxID=3242163 RepID=UPI00351E2BB2
MDNGFENEFSASYKVGVSHLSKSIKMTVWFFTAYVLLTASLISIVVFIDFDQSASPIKNIDSNSTFKEELMKYERKVEADANKEASPPSFRVSDEFAIAAVTGGALLDIIIVVLWARKENQKMEGKDIHSKKRWRDTKLFWNIVAMGVVQPKNNKYAINWFNMIGITILLHVLFYILFTKY